MSLQDEIDAKAQEIHSDSYAMSLGELVSLYRGEEIDIHPEFQRFFRWELEQKSALIESILLGIPIPSIFVAQRDDGVWDVIDGLQRLSSVFEFMGELRGEEGLLPPISLVGTAYLPSLRNKLWDHEDDTRSLTNSQRLQIKRAKLAINIIRRESDPKTKYDLFQRLNTGGTPLTAQEVRNCILLTVDRDFYQWLVSLSRIEDFENCTALSDRQVAERYDVELTLRLLSCLHAPLEEGSRIPDVDGYLTDSMLSFAEDDAFDRVAAENAFRSVFAFAAATLGADCFRRFDPARQRFAGGFSVSAFETVAVGIARNAEAWGALELRDATARLQGRIVDMWTDTEGWRRRTGSGIRGTDRIPFTIRYGLERIRP